MSKTKKAKKEDAPETIAAPESAPEKKPNPKKAAPAGENEVRPVYRMTPSHGKPIRFDGHHSSGTVRAYMTRPWIPKDAEAVCQTNGWACPANILMFVKQLTDAYAEYRETEGGPALKAQCAPLDELEHALQHRAPEGDAPAERTVAAAAAPKKTAGKAAKAKPDAPKKGGKKKPDPAPAEENEENDDSEGEENEAPAPKKGAKAGGKPAASKAKPDASGKKTRREEIFEILDKEALTERDLAARLGLTTITGILKDEGVCDVPRIKRQHVEGQRAALYSLTKRGKEDLRKGLVNENAAEPAGGRTWRD